MAQSVAGQGLERFDSLTHMFFTRVAARGDRPFLWRKQDGEWQPLSWIAVARQVTRLAAALQANGIRPGDRVMLVSENRPEFCIADLAIMAAGAVTVPTYTTNTSRDHAHIVGNSGARAVIYSTPAIAAKLMPAIPGSAIALVVGMDGAASRYASGVKSCGWDEMMEGQPDDWRALAERQSARRDDLACVIYTSGTGGAPRGVRQHHGAILTNVAGCVDIIAADFERDEDEVFLSFLPLSHAYEHSGGQFLPIGLGGQIYYAEGLDKLAANIAETRPTIMVVVPRLFEMLRTRISQAVAKEGRLPALLLDRALALGERQDRRGRSILDAPLDFLLERTLRPKIRARFGGRMKALVSGGAPLNPEVGRFFRSLGLTLLQGYGQTEAGPVISCNRPAAGIAMDTVGPPLKDVEVRIADDGEILVRGELVMHGYWQDAEASAQVLRDGWLHTGDIGEIDARGRLRITDRKKDLIVNDKGDNVAPQRIEAMLTLQPEIAQAMVHGDKRPHLVALLVPDSDYLADVTEEERVKALRSAVDRVNAGLGIVERVRRFALADEPFAIDNAEMTPSLKIRRHAIRARYQDRLDALYGGGAGS